MVIKNYYQVVEFIFLIALTIIIFYFTPKPIQILFFILILILIWRSKRDYFWLAYSLVLTTDIGGFFYTQTSDILVLGPVKLSFFFLYSPVIFIKTILQQKRTYFFLSNSFKIYLFYLFFLIFLGFFIYGNDGGGRSGYRNYIYILWFFIYLLNFYSIPRILDSQLIVEKFIYLIFICFFINLLGQIYHLINGAPFFLKFGTVVEVYREVDFRKELIRPAFGHPIIFIGMSSAMYYYIVKNKSFHHLFLLLVIFTGLASIFIGATRGWIIAFLFLLVGFGFLIRIDRFVRILFLGITLTLLILNLSSSSMTQVSKVLERLSTLESLAQGDLTANNSNSRLTLRHDRVISAFYERPIFGNGFSTMGFARTDGHVGNQNILMSGGMIGFCIIGYFWLSFVIYVLKYRGRLPKQDHKRNGLIFLLFVLLASLIIHSSSMQIYSYLFYAKAYGTLFFVIVLYSVLNQQLQNE